MIKGTCDLCGKELSRDEIKMVFNPFRYHVDILTVFKLEDKDICDECLEKIINENKEIQEEIKKKKDKMAKYALSKIYGGE